VEKICRKQLEDPMSMDQLLQTRLQISDQFMSLCEDFVPKNANRYAQLMTVSSKGFDDSSLVTEVMKG
jgi:uncharacterized protein YfbU (UPF0304 family)